jgi:formate dehydrogenase subunit delta
MDLANLVKMANQIGQFFHSYPDQEEAVAEVAAHIRRFWEPRMRHAIIAHMDHGADHGLLPIVIEALHRLKQADVSPT